MSKNKLISKIKNVERIASANKLKRMLMHPFKYFNAILFRELVYKKTRREKEVVCSTFFNSKMHIFLPSSTDIYLTGGKSHSSEIRLAKFLINFLNNNDIFIDVGAHYGYFSLLASKLVGKSGKVIAFEASPTTYKILQKNESNFENIIVYNLAVSDEEKQLTFYEFPNLYSEYNSLDIDQFKDKYWFSEYTPKSVRIKSILIADFIEEKKINPNIIKIDVEGAEFRVINGLRKYLINNSPMIVMEYLSTNRSNEEHIKAERLLKSLGYQSFLINNNGEPQETESITKYLDTHNLESDNILFMKNIITN